MPVESPPWRRGPQPWEGLKKEQEFEAVYRQVEPVVRAIGRRNRDVLRRSAEDETDLVQETVVRIFRAYKSTGVRNPGGLACRITNALVADRCRKRSAPMDELDVEAIDVEALGSVSAEVEAHESDQELAEIRLLVLDQIEQRAVELRADGVKREQIARDLRISVRDVQTALQRARRKLERARTDWDRHGLCWLVAPVLVDIASGALDQGDRRWAAGHNHLRRCRQCGQRVASIRRADHLVTLSENGETRRIAKPRVSEPPELRLNEHEGPQTIRMPTVQVR